jgi:hypothetical protein
VHDGLGGPGRSETAAAGYALDLMRGQGDARRFNADGSKSLAVTGAPLTRLHAPSAALSNTANTVNGIL